MDRFSVGYDNSTFIFADMLSNPTKDEIAAFSSNTPGEIRFVEIDDVIFFLMKLGNMSWQDAPFTPHWSDPKPFYLPIPDSNNGYMFQLILIDSLTMTQKKTRIIGSGDAFANRLHSVISTNYLKPFSIDAYSAKINKIYSRYTSDQLAELCPENQRYIIGTKDAANNPQKFVDPDIPKELERWLCCPPDAGMTMCVYCVPKCLLKDKCDLEDLIVPIPLKYVLDTGYTIIDNGFICIDVEYNEFLGVVLPSEYEE